MNAKNCFAYNLPTTEKLEYPSKGMYTVFTGRESTLEVS